MSPPPGWAFPWARRRSEPDINDFAPPRTCHLGDPPTYLRKRSSANRLCFMVAANNVIEAAPKRSRLPAVRCELVIAAGSAQRATLLTAPPLAVAGGCSVSGVGCILGCG